MLAIRQVSYIDERKASVREVVLFALGLRFPVEQNFPGMIELAAVIVIAAPDLAPALKLLDDILGDIFGCVLLIAVQVHGGGEAEPPVGQIVDRHALGLAPAVHQTHGGAVDEAMEVNGPVLVKLRHKDVTEALPPDLIVQPGVEALHDRAIIVAVDLTRVEGERDKEVEVVAHDQVEKLFPGPAGSPFEAFTLLGGPAIASGGGCFLSLPYFPVGRPIVPALRPFPGFNVIACENGPAGPHALQDLARGRKLHPAICPGFGGSHRPHGRPVHTSDGILCP